MASFEKVTKTLVIKPGETVVLPKGAVITAVGIKGDATATSTCPAVQEALDNAEQYKCYSFGIGCDDDNNDSHVMDENNARIKKIIVGGQTYEFTTNNGIVVDWLDNFTYVSGEITSKIQKEILEVYNVSLNHFDKRKEFTIRTSMLPSIAADALFYAEGTGFVNGLYLKPVEITCPGGTTD